MSTRDVDWSRYPVRTCRTLHHCRICRGDIVLGERYRDGGYSRRAHVACVRNPPTEMRRAQS